MLAHLQQNTPYYHKNQSKVCVYYQKGNCTRGNDCPYRYVDINRIKRWIFVKNICFIFRHGASVPSQNAGNKKNSGTLLPPQDTSITTLYVGGIKENITESDIRLVHLVILN